MTAPTIRSGIATRQRRFRSHVSHGRRRNKHRIHQMKIEAGQQYRLELERPYYSNVRAFKSKELNDQFIGRLVGGSSSPSKFKTPHRPADESHPAALVTYRRSSGKVHYVRVSGDKSKRGGWLLRREDFERILRFPNPGLALKELLALPTIPRFYRHFIPPKGKEVELSVSIANGRNDLGTGGALQFNLRNRPAQSWFGRLRRIGTSK